MTSWPIASVGRALAVLLAAAIPFGHAGAGEKLRLIVTHSVPPLVPNSVMDLAETLGFYDRAGVSVEIVRVQQTPLAIAALHNGYGDMANVSVSAVLQATARGEMKLKAVVSPDKTMSFLVAGRSGLDSPKSLEGMALGVGRIGSLDYSMTRVVLSTLGVEVDKIKLAAMGEPHVRAQALIGGRIDATTISIGLWTSLRDKSGLRMLVSPEAYYRAAPILNKVNVVDPLTLAAKRVAIERFIDAILLASRSFAAHPEIWAETMHAIHPEIPIAELDRLSRAYAESWSVNGGLNPAQIAYSVDENYRQPEFEGLRRLAFADWVELGPVDSALQHLGTVPDLDETGR